MAIWYIILGFVGIMLYLAIGTFIGVLGLEDDDPYIIFMVVFWPVCIVGFIVFWIMKLGPARLAEYVKRKFKNKDN